MTGYNKGSISYTLKPSRRGVPASMVIRARNTWRNLDRFYTASLEEGVICVDADGGNHRCFALNSDNFNCLGVLPKTHAVRKGKIGYYTVSSEELQSAAKRWDAQIAAEAPYYDSGVINCYLMLRVKNPKIMRSLEDSELGEDRVF